MRPSIGPALSAPYGAGLSPRRQHR